MSRIMKANRMKLDKKVSSDKENVNINIIKRVSASNAEKSTEGPTRKSNTKTIEAVVTPTLKKKQLKKDKKEGCEEEEVLIPIDDFVINGICAHKVQAATRALVIANPPGVAMTKGMASPFSPLSDVQSYKAGTRVQAIIRPTPNVIDFEKEGMMRRVNPKERRNDTLECTWDKQKTKRGNSENSIVAEKRDKEEEEEGGKEEECEEVNVANSHDEQDFGQEASMAMSAFREAQLANEELKKALQEAKIKCARIDEVSAINENISRVATSLRADRDGKAAEVHALQNKLSEAENTIKLLNNQIASLDHLNSQLCEEMASNQSILETKSARLEEMHELVMSASPIRSPLKDELEKYSRQIQAKEREVSDLKRELDSMAATVSESKRATQLATEKLSVIEVKYDEVREQLNGNHSVNIKKEEEWKTRLQAKEVALEHAEAELSSMRQKLIAKEDELMTLLHSSVQSSDIAAAKLQKERESLIAAQAELESAKDKLAHFAKRDVKHGAELESLRMSLTNEIKSLTEEKRELRQSCNAYRISLESTRERLRSLEMGIQAGTVSLRSPAANHINTENSPVSDTFASPASSEGGIEDKARIAELENDLRMARDLLVQYSRSKSDKIASMETLLSALETEEGAEGEDPGDNAIFTAAASNPEKLEKNLVAKFIKSEERCKELLIELTSSQEEHEKAQRTIKHLTEEFERSKALLEKQLSSSSSSTGELANKMCDMNENAEHLMQYSLKLTEELQTSKENETRLMETVDSMRVQLEEMKRDRNELTRQLNDVTQQVDIMNTRDEIPPAQDGGEDDGVMGSNNTEKILTYDLQELRKQIQEKDIVISELQEKYAEMNSQMEMAATTLEKAKQSKIKRYNKYIALQNEYKVVVAQVRKLLTENGELKARHKSFVRTVEQTLVGGDGKAALVETFSNEGQATMVVPTAGNFNDIAWVAPTPTHSDNDITTSTVPSYAASGPQTGSTIASVVVTPSDTQDTKKRPSANNGAVAFEDLAFEFAAEEGE